MASKLRAKPLIIEWLLVLIISALLSGVAYFAIKSIVGNDPPLRLIGAGSSFSAPVWTALMDQYGAMDTSSSVLLMRYFPTTVGEVLNVSQSGYATFGATDDPLIVNSSSPFALLPTFVGAVGIIYNLETPTPERVVLSMGLLVGIFNGSVTEWSHPEIHKLNPNIKHLLTGSITPLRRSLPSGTTYLFTDALSNWSPEWNATYGTHPDINWGFTQNITIPENDDLITAVASHKGAIGYIGISGPDIFTLERFRGVQFAQIINRAGNVTLPQRESVQAVIDSVVWSNESYTYDLVDYNCSQCWPIVGFTYVTVLKNYITHPDYYAYPSCDHVAATMMFLKWVLTNAEADRVIESEQFHVPPKDVTNKIVRAIDQVKCDGKYITAGKVKIHWEWLGAGLAVALVVIVGIVRLFVSHRICHRKLDTYNIQEDSSADESLPLMTKDVEANLVYPRHKSLLNNDELELIKPIGKGSFGEVFVGKWRGTIVAIKRMLISDPETVLAAFVKEASLMASLRHPNIVMFLGASIKPPHVCLVTELCGRGSLFDVIHTPGFELTPSRRKSMLVDAALGMMYLHSEDIIHRDLKTQNLLVTDDWSVKVGDFGTSKVLDSSRTMTQCGTVHYAAPEVFLRADKISKKSDVYSFGVVMWDLFCFPEELYPNMSVFDVMDGVARNGLRPPLHSIKSAQIRALIKRCWAEDPDARPTFAELVDSLREMPLSEFVV